MQQFRAGLVLALIFLAADRIALAQIDPDRRELIEVGYDQPLQGAAPVAAYGYYYNNEPHYPWTNTTLRLALAPVYVDAELGISHALGPNTDLGIGASGGGFADSYFEFLKGKFLPASSFFGNGAGVSGSICHLFNPGDRIPLSGIVRVRDGFSVYERRSDTSSDFMLPSDHSTLSLRTGLRWGGREPLLFPELAMELSAWCEGQYRFDSGPYGYNGDRDLRSDSEMIWARGLLIYTLPESKQTISATLNGGTCIDPDRFSAYRLGGNLPLSSEFPLEIPGYFYQELSAVSFVNFAGEYSLPLDPAKQWRVNLVGAVADLDYTPGLEQNGHFNSGAGIGMGCRSKTGTWQVQASYGYGFEAIRSSGRGGQSIGILCQMDLNARRAASSHLSPDSPSYFQKFVHSLQNLF
jgi:hypothetical protein